MSAIHVLREGQPVGPLDPESLRAELAAGRLRGSDLGWTEGQAGWRPLAEVVGGGPATGVGSTPPPPPFAPVPAGAPAIQLWNVCAAGRWGILLGPAVPAHLVWCNWQALGETTRAAGARLTFHLLFAVQVVIQAVGLFTTKSHGLTLVWLALGVGYHYLGARPAAAAQRPAAGTGAGVTASSRQPLWRPLLAGAGAQLAVAFALLVAQGAWEGLVGGDFGSPPQLEVTAIPGGPFGVPAAVLVTSHEEAPIAVRRVVANGHAELKNKVTVAAGFMPGAEPFRGPALLKTGESLGLHVEGLGLENLVKVRVETDRGAYECRWDASSQQ